jgi:Lrp/AsnC family leucine-responsive transcriptional regulator
MLDDDTDRIIVRTLAADGRTSYTDLARAAGLSVSAVHQRVRRLESRGVLRGYTVQLDAEALGLPLTAFVSVRPVSPDGGGDTPRKLAHLTAVEACHSVAGEDTYLLKVRVASTRALEDLLAEIRSAGDVLARATVVLSTAWEGRPAVP